MPGTQRTRFDVRPPHPATGYGTRQSQSAKADEVPLVGPLDGEVVREGKVPTASGTHADVWEGRWKRSDGEKGGKGIHDEMVGLSLTTSTLLT